MLYQQNCGVNSKFIGHRCTAHMMDKLWTVESNLWSKAEHDNKSYILTLYKKKLNHLIKTSTFTFKV